MFIEREKINCNHLLVVILLATFLFVPLMADAAPTLNFSDIESGPKTGNTDGAGGLSPSQHGAIVTVWGNYSGSSTKVYFTDSQGVSQKAAHIYYEKKADGKLPGGPSDLYTYHKMREIAFSIPATSADGPGQISLIVDEATSTNTLPFTVRKGNIYFIKSSGSDTTGDGSWSAPWLTLAKVMSGNGKVVAGDSIYSVGVGSASGISVGQSAAIKGTLTNPVSLITYPNTAVALSGQGYTGYVIFNYNNDNSLLASEYINFSKLKITAAGDGTGTGSSAGIRVFKGNRVIGLEITGPTVYGGFAGAIAGNNSGAGGGKYYGIYIHNFGTANKVPYAGNIGTDPSTCAYSNPACKSSWDKFHHLYYISNRFATTLDAYEIAWNHLSDNPIWQGIHIYDQGTVGGWNGTMKIHHNVVKNQRGSAINIDLQSPMTVAPPIEIHDNLIISDTMDTYNFRAFHVLAPNCNVKLYNNTVYGYNSANLISAKMWNYTNNLMVDTKGVPYIVSAPTAQSNNLFFSAFSPSLAIPSWANGAVNVDPMFKDPANGNLDLKSDSTIRNSGTDVVIPTSDSDFFGKPRKSGNISIGAIDYDTTPKKLGGGWQK